MDHGHDTVSDEVLGKHFVYVGAMMMAVALVIGFVANNIG